MSGFLIDENLPADFAKWLGSVCVHAATVGEQPSDLTLWEYARQHDLIVVTKDADFFDLLSLQGSPPKVVWVRTGNLRRLTLERTCSGSGGRKSSLCLRTLIWWRSTTTAPRRLDFSRCEGPT